MKTTLQYSVMKNQSENIDARIEQFEEGLAHIYGEQFVFDLQKMCYIKKAFTPQLQEMYLTMLRGAWYAAHQIKLTSKN